MRSEEGQKGRFFFYNIISKKYFESVFNFSFSTVPPQATIGYIIIEIIKVDITFLSEIDVDL